MGNNVEWNKVDCATVSNKFSSVNSIDFWGYNFSGPMELGSGQRGWGYLKFQSILMFCEDFFRLVIQWVQLPATWEPIKLTFLSLKSRYYYFSKSTLLHLTLFPNPQFCACDSVLIGHFLNKSPQKLIIGIVRFLTIFVINLV